MEYVVASFALGALPLAGLAAGACIAMMFSSHHSRRH